MNQLTAAPPSGFAGHEETMQSSCVRLMAKKMLVSLAVEGKFNGEGLQSFEEDDDMLTAMARELVTEHRIGESADALWRQLQTEQIRLLPTVSLVAEEPEVPSVPSPPALPPSSVLTVPGVASALEFGLRPPPSGKRLQQGPPPAHEQFSLF
jgi:hypothetical protein